jgi:GrpB-like predicted nucleotidyltransferase (UPF0157 family)
MKYVFKPYNENFPRLFEAEKLRLQTLLDKSIQIEHIGSTAVPGLGGKGIIDIAICVEKDAFEIVSQQLQKLGYEFRPNYSTSERLYFVIFLADLENASRRYHIHLTYPDSNDWKGFIEFRDCLRNNPEKTKEYADVKKFAAEEANQDGEKYRQLKKHIFKNS